MSLALYSIPFTNYSILLYNSPFLLKHTLNYSKIDQFKSGPPLDFFCLCSLPFLYNLMLLSISLSIYKQVRDCDKKLQFKGAATSCLLRDRYCFLDVLEGILIIAYFFIGHPNVIVSDTCIGMLFAFSFSNAFSKNFKASFQSHTL